MLHGSLGFMSMSDGPVSLWQDQYRNIAKMPLETRVLIVNGEATR